MFGDMRSPSTDGLFVGDEFLYCPSCPFQLRPGQAAIPACPECGARLRVWRVEDGVQAAVDKDEFVRRISICLECPEMRRAPDGRGEGFPHCGLCGCPLTEFPKLKESHCKDPNKPRW